MMQMMTDDTSVYNSASEEFLQNKIDVVDADVVVKEENISKGVVSSIIVDIWYEKSVSGLSM